MKSIGRMCSLAGAACLFAAQAWAGDGVLLVQKTTIGAGPAQTSQVQIEPRRMRMETGGARGGGVVVFDGARQVMLMIDDAGKKYSEISKADVDAMGDMMAQMLKSLPPEQRAQAEAMMRGRAGRGGMSAGTPSKIEYKKTGTDTVGKWTCDKYEGYRDGQKVSDLCTVDPKVLGFTAADFAVTKDLAAFFEKLMPAAASQMIRLGTPEEQGFSGIPIRTVTTTGTQTVTSEIAEVKRQSFPESTFQVPAGYAKQDSPLGGMRGRRGGGL